MDILCISGKVKALEKTFLTGNDISRIVNAKSFSEVVALLNGTIYQMPHPINTPSEIYNFFDVILINLMNDMQKALPEKLYYYFLLPYDFHNLKLVLENYKTRKESKNYVLYSSVDYFIVKEAFEKKNFKEIPFHLKPLVVFISKNKDIEDILLRVKKIYWDIAKNLVKTQNSNFIDGYIKIEIDISNIGTFIQQQIAGIPLDLSVIVDGGRIKKGRYIREEVLWGTVNMLYPGVETPITVENYDIVRYNVLMSHLKNARIIPSGIETIFSYYAARQIEIDNIRRILLSKFYNVEVSKIEEWILPGYQYTG